MRTILFYVSGHGFGHAVRMAEVMRALGGIRPDWRILARTQAPRDKFPEAAEVSASEFESGAVERESAIAIDEPATLARVQALLERWDTIVDRETAFARAEKVDLIVADIPPIAGDIARALGVPCIAISNFTWDWIYEPFGPPSLVRFEQAYARMEVLLRLPFAQTSRLEPFARIVDAPLIGRKSRQRFRPGARKRVFLASRVQAPDGVIAEVSGKLPEFEFVRPNADENFADVLASCDLVIAKLGFSMLAECIVAGKPVLYPPRVNFREETMLQAQAGQHIPALPIPLEEFDSGNWGPYLRQLVSLPPVQSNLRTDGALFCASFLADT